MNDDELDRILSAERGIVPSPNFARNVMAKVRMEAAAPPPLPFPWTRALPGLALCALCLSAILMAAFLRPGAQLPRPAAGPSVWTAIGTELFSDAQALWRVTSRGGWAWIILALLLTFSSVTLSLRLVRRRA